MFPRMNITNPFQSFAFGVPQYGVGFGGINPMVSHLAFPNASNPIAALSGIGVNPYMLGQTQYVHPLPVAQLATTNPTLLPLLAQHSAIGQSPYGIQSLPQPQLGQIGSPFQQFGQFGQFGPFGAGIGQWGNPFIQWSPLLQQGWGQQWGVPTLLNSPVPGVDPITGALIAQQPSLLVQSQLPIRPLITPQQSDPFQMAVLIGAMTGQATDPYSVLTQPGLTSPLGVNPIHQALKQQYGAPHAGISF
jgi:hypothetical protein